MNRIRQLFSDLQARFAALSSREQRLVTVAGVAVLAFVIFATVMTFANKANTYRSRTEEKLAQLQEVQQLAATYSQATAARNAIEQQLTNSDVRLISFISDKATAAGLDAPNMTPKGEVGIGDGKIVESSLEFTFTDVDLRKLTEFLRSVESGPGIVKVKYLRIEPRPASDSLTAWATVSTYKLKQQSAQPPQ
jgi:general secretion pathway protein M